MPTIKSDFNGEALLRIEGLSKYFDGQKVLDSVSLDVHPGEVVSIIGPSGSGKSTLLRCATLLERMDEGKMEYLDQVVCKPDEPVGKSVYIPDRDLRKVHQYFGLVFQNFNLFPHYTVLRNITDAQIRVLKKDRAEAETTARRLLAQFNLENKAEAYPCQLSGGQQQRVSVARALALEPQILFLDEPTSALDPELTQEVLKVLRQLADEHMTMVIVTHELGFAREVSDRMIFLDNGKILENSTPKEIFSTSNSRIQEFLSKLSS